MGHGQQKAAGLIILAAFRASEAAMKRGRKRSHIVDAIAAEVFAGASLSIVARKHGMSVPNLSQAIARRLGEAAKDRKMGRPRKADYSQIAAMVNDGHGAEEVARVFGVSCDTVRRAHRASKAKRSRIQRGSVEAPTGQAPGAVLP